MEKIKSDAHVRIADQGIGIAPEDCERIFLQFERAVPGNEFEGFGLGLYISQEIAPRHGGRITVESALGRGSTFCLILPLS